MPVTSQSHNEVIEADVAVIGAGVAGLRAAIEASKHAQVLVLAKDNLADSNTRFAQGGIAVALSDEDQVGFHLEDTLRAGCGLSDPEVAYILVEEGLKRVEELLEWGAKFDKTGGKLIFGLEGAHTRRRVLHAGGDSTGQEIIRTLLQKARTLPSIRFLDHTYTLDTLLDDQGRCCGILVLMGIQNPRSCYIRCSRVILATGGVGRIFQFTTNPLFATADGTGIAIRVGAKLRDMEFIQFHPTALNLPDMPNFLLTEALRGEGARLVTEDFQPFMQNYDPRGDLASRDIVARAIYIETTKGQKVFLDTRHLDPALLTKRFPQVSKTLNSYGLQLGRDLIPVTPAAHYIMGGVWTDKEGRTSIEGIYAAGEVACNGVHGANRLASNSLLDGLVFGARAGAAAVAQPFDRPLAASYPFEGLKIPHAPIPSYDLKNKAWQALGLVRNHKTLAKFLKETSQILAEFPYPCSTRASAEFLNSLLTAWFMAAFALLRKESRGAHFRSDYPHSDPSLQTSQIMTPQETWNRVAREIDIAPFLK